MKIFKEMTADELRAFEEYQTAVKVQSALLANALGNETNLTNQLRVAESKLQSARDELKDYRDYSTQVRDHAQERLRELQQTLKEQEVKLTGAIANCTDLTCTEAYLNSTIYSKQQVINELKSHIDSEALVKAELQKNLKANDEGFQMMMYAKEQVIDELKKNQGVLIKESCEMLEANNENLEIIRTLRENIHFYRDKDKDKVLIDRSKLHQLIETHPYACQYCKKADDDGCNLDMCYKNITKWLTTKEEK